MARRLRIELPGGLYHVVSRGNRGQTLFADDEDRRSFLRTLEETCFKTRWDVRAYCLMKDHVHLVFLTPEPNLAAGMKWMLGTYAARANRRHQLRGHLFSNRYRSLSIEAAPFYIQTVTDYVHLNPARAGLVKPEQSLFEYEWSSLRGFMSSPEHRPGWLHVDGILGSRGAFPDTHLGRHQFEGRLEALRVGAEPAEFGQIRRGWYFGTERFRRKLLAQISVRANRNHYGSELREAAEAKAETIVNESLKAVGWKDAELRGSAKGDLTKLEIARRLRKESTVTLAWIARRLHMGTRTYVAHLLYWGKRKRTDAGTDLRRKPVPGGRRRSSVSSHRQPAGNEGHSAILLTDPNAPSARPMAHPASSPPGSGTVDIAFDPSFD